MIQKQNLAGLDIDLFANIFVDRIENVVNYFNIHRCTLDFDSIFLSLLVKENK